MFSQTFHKLERFPKKTSNNQNDFINTSQDNSFNMSSLKTNISFNGSIASSSYFGINNQACHKTANPNATKPLNHNSNLFFALPSEKKPLKKHQISNGVKN
jgi:hypothetical protein